MNKGRETILVTGGAGFIGSHLVDRLLEKEFFVISVDNFFSNYSKPLKKQNIVRHFDYKNFRLEINDIRSINVLERVFRKYHISRIIHLAALTGVRNSVANPLLYQQVNIGGTYNLLYLAKKFSVKQFIFASSSSVYGNAQLPFDEKSPATEPLSPYAATKRSGELACYSFHMFYRLPVTILRLFSVYGPRGRPDMAPYLFTHAIDHNKTILQFGSGIASRDWTYISDIIDGIYLTIKHLKPYAVYNLGSMQPVPLHKLIRTIEKVYGKRAKIKKTLPRKEESKITFANNTLAKRELGWSPKVKFEQGIKEFIVWYKQNANRLK